MIHLKQRFKKIIPEMKEKFGYKNEMAVPEIKKVVINTSFGKLISEVSDKEKKIESILRDLSLITGQRPVLTKARKSISAFEVKKGDPVGAKVTLRGKKMYDFLERLIHIALPRSRDFRGLDPSSIDNQGNLTIPIKEHIAFPEILPEESESMFGLEITMVTDAETREEALSLFKLLKFPLKKHGSES